MLQMYYAKRKTLIKESKLKFSFDVRSDMKVPKIKGADATYLERPLEDIIQEHFFKEFGYYQTWPRLKPATLDQRQRQGFPYPAYPMLFKRGDVQRSYKILLSTPEKIAFGSKNEIAVYLEVGTKKMEGRRRLYLMSKEYDILGNILADNFAKTLI